MGNTLIWFICPSKKNISYVMLNAMDDVEHLTMHVMYDGNLSKEMLWRSHNFLKFIKMIRAEVIKQLKEEMEDLDDQKNKKINLELN